MKRLPILHAVLSVTLLMLFVPALAATPAGPSSETPGNPEVICYSDPCEGWGGYRVSCTGISYCLGRPDHVVCDGTTTYCPDPCALNAICNFSCPYDPDCLCDPGAMCFDNDECGPLGFCHREQPYNIVGYCVCVE